ncbi:hypothetical protein PybrP1_005740, partial [[Pythium] brassicae (nom. inval.)]
TVKLELLKFLAEYEFAKDKAEITDEEILEKYFMLFNRLVEDNGLVDILRKCSRSLPDFTTKTKTRTKILITNLMSPMLQEEIHGMAEYKSIHAHTDKQALYKLFEDPSNFRATNDYTKVNAKTVSIAGTTPLFANQMQTVYKDMFYKGTLIWIDDVIVYGKSQEEFVTNFCLFYSLAD